MIDDEPHLAAARPGLLILADEGYITAELDRFLTVHGISLLRSSYRNRGTSRPGEPCSRTVRQLLERPTTPSKANSVWAGTADAPSRASVSVRPSGSWQ